MSNFDRKNLFKFLLLIVRGSKYNGLVENNYLKIMIYLENETLQDFIAYYSKVCLKKL